MIWRLVGAVAVILAQDCFIKGKGRVNMTRPRGRDGDYGTVTTTDALCTRFPVVALAVAVMVKV